MTVYYNEFDPFAAQWLRNLILAGHLPRGDVDTRSITEVQPDDLRGYLSSRFTAGCQHQASQPAMRRIGVEAWVPHL